MVSPAFAVNPTVAVSVSPRVRVAAGPRVRVCVAGAAGANAALLPVFTGVFATQGCMLVKAGLAARGFGPAVLRQPLLPASEAQAAAFVALLDAAGL